MKAADITTKWILDIAGWKAFNAGKALFQAGMVSGATYKPPLLSGLVQDRKKFKTMLKVGDSNQTLCLCTCPEGRQSMICSHAVAVALSFEKLEKFRNESEITPSPTTETPELGFKEKGNLTLLGGLPASVDASGSRLELRVVFPLHLTKIWASGELPVTWQARLDGGAWMSLPSVPRHPDHPYCVSEIDSILLSWIVNIANNSLPHVISVPQSLRASFLEKLVDHPFVFLGSDQLLSLSRTQARPTVRVSQDTNLKLELIDSRPQGISFKCKDGCWELYNHHIEWREKLPGTWIPEGQSSAILNENQTAEFYRLGMTECEKVARIDFIGQMPTLINESPQFRIYLNGGLKSLRCHVTALYGTHERKIEGLPREFKIPEEWMQSGDNQYNLRQPDIEEQMRKDIVAAGFRPELLARHDYRIKNERETLLFLSSHFPIWKERWNLILGEDLQAALQKCESLIPQISVFPGQDGWLDVDFKFVDSKGKALLTPEEVNRLLSKGDPRKVLNDGKMALVPLTLMERFREVLRDCGIRQEGGAIRLPRQQSGYFYEALKANRWDISARSVWNPPPEISALKPIQLPASLDSILRPYQKLGVSWLTWLANNGFHGVLADEMGLGKTLQVITWLLTRKTIKQNSLPSLVVCPTSLVGNWRAEVRRFAPELKILVLHGSDRAQKFPEITNADLVVTSYALLRRDIQEYESRTFDVIVLDEAQHIKNRESQIANAAKKLKSDHRLVLTGTPMENSVLDLWSLYDFLMPGYLSDATEFKERYEQPIVRDQNVEALNRLRQRLKPFMLRRTKADVLTDLPNRIEQTLFCELTPEQKGVYQSLLQQSQREVEQALTDLGENKGRMVLLTALMRLRQASCHLGLLPALEGREWKDPSGKGDSLFELLNEAIDGGHRVLVFTQFVQWMRLLEKEFTKRKISHVSLDGSTTNREEIVATFQQGETSVFLISLKAGGVGLNLTAADTVILLDPWWNPAVEEQAMSRAHRMGQKNVVNCYKLIASGTVEEKILELQAKKKEWIAGAIGDEGGIIQSLTVDELKKLLA